MQKYSYLLFFIFVLFSILLSAGCANCDSFYAVSTAKDGSGGIYQIKNDSCKQLAKFPTLNAIAVHPQSGHIFGTANRIPGSRSRSGAVAVFGEKDGKLSLLQTLSANGRTPCHLCFSPCGNFLYTANYSSGDITEFVIQKGVPLAPPKVIKHKGKSVTPRQKSPHPHYVGFDPAGKQLFVCDLGTDEVVIYNWTKEKGILLPCAGKVKLPAGSGPRHLVFDPAGNVFYTANELNSTATSFIRNKDGSWQFGMTSATLPPGSTGRNFPGAIKITRDGRYFFITNRGNDSIALFSADGKGKFKLLETVRVKGKFPSDILILQDKKRIAISNLLSGDLSLFTFDPDKGKLIAEEKIATIQSPIFLCR